ncbi:hypothetical protein [Dactylosporangium sp. CS-033363]|uniref:hypothetical protein n=1 Tax=Dactylosporangium sp. CS-033363 TaxID=3239935 RepID=UPI003D8E40C5
MLIFGSPWYVDWVNSGDRGIFLETLAWPAWAFDSDASVRDLLGADLKAILLIVFTALFITLLVGAQLASARGTISAIFTGWAAYIFAAALAAFITSFLLANPSFGQATANAAGGAGYGLIVGWIIGLATMAGRRP